MGCEGMIKFKTISLEFVFQKCGFILPCVCIQYSQRYSMLPLVISTDFFIDIIQSLIQKKRD